MTAAVRIGVVAVVLLGAGAACGTETGNPEELALAWQATSTEPDAIAIRAPADAAEVDAVWLRLGDVTIEPCDDAAPARVAGLGFADHADPAPVIQRAELGFDVACGLTTPLVAGPGDPSEPAAVAGASLALDGVLADGRAFTVVLEDEVPVRLALDEAPVPAAGGWLVAFDVATWLDAGALAALPDDPIRVDAATHPELLADLVGRIPAGIELREDLDGDGVIDPDEGPVAP